MDMSSSGLHITQQNISAYQGFKNIGMGEEPIYQNVGSLFPNIQDDRRERTKSAPQLDDVLNRPEGVTATPQMNHGGRIIDESARNRAISHPRPNEHLSQSGNPLANSYEHVQQHPYQNQPIHHIKMPPQYVQEIPAEPVHPVATSQLHYHSKAFKQRVNAPNVAVAHSKDLKNSAVPTAIPSQPPPYQPQPHPRTRFNQRREDVHTKLEIQKISDTSQEESIATLRSSLEAKENSDVPDLLPGNISTRTVGSKDSRVEQLEAKMEQLELVKEFEAIPRIKPSAIFASAHRPESLSRNRYKDIVPYDENRVKITPSKDNKSGYINASHITASVGDTQRFYICAQGPLPTTVGHFWQCVWETDVRLIVMLTSVVGVSASSKSFPYWPQADNTSVECDQYRIYRKHSTESSCYTTCRLQVVNTAERKSRSVWHLQFTEWADHGCPEDTQGFIGFLQELATLRRLTYTEVEGVGRNRNTPVLVHCLAGVGRSGVTILCDLLIEAVDHNLTIDPPKMLLHLRQQRMCLVQSINQYKFVYKVLIAYLEKGRLI